MNFAVRYINDIGLDPCPHAETGEMGFNVKLGGYMSIKRVAESLLLDMWVPADPAGEDVTHVVTLCEVQSAIFCFMLVNLSVNSMYRDLIRFL